MHPSMSCRHHNILIREQYGHTQDTGSFTDQGIPAVLVGTKQDGPGWLHSSTFGQPGVQGHLFLFIFTSFFLLMVVSVCPDTIPTWDQTRMGTSTRTLILEYDAAKQPNHTKNKMHARIWTKRYTDKHQFKITKRNIKMGKPTSPSKWRARATQKA